jgi:hypothetical protein
MASFLSLGVSPSSERAPSPYEGCRTARRLPIAGGDYNPVLKGFRFPHLTRVAAAPGGS